MRNKLFKLFLSAICFLIIYNCRSNNIALPCLGCHALEDNTIPNIKGLDYEYFIDAFKAYKNNERTHYVMRIIAKGYSDAQIHLMAAYFEVLDDK